MKSLFCVFILLLSHSLQAQSDVEKICGTWLSTGEKGQGVVEIYQAANGKIYGKLIKALNEEQQQTLEEELHAAGKETLLVLRDFEAKGNGHWYNGQLLLPNRKRLFDGELKLQSPDTLEVIGKWGFISQSRIWTKME